MDSGRLKPGWTRVAFGSVARHVKDHVDPATAGLRRYVAGEHMDTDDLRIRRWGAVGEGYLGPAFHMRFRPGHVLYGSRRTYLRKVAVADFEGVTANTTFVIETRDPNMLLPELLPFIMQTESFHEHSIKKSKGSVNPYVNFSDIAAYEFALPPLDEQRRFVRARQCCDGFLESLRRLQCRLVTARSAHLTSLTHMLQTVVLGDLIRRIEPGRSVLGLQRSPTGVEYGVLKVSAVDPHGFRPSESKVLIERALFDHRHRVNRNELLMTRANTPELVGEVCLVEADYHNLMLSDKIFRLVPEDGVNSELLWYVLQSGTVRRQLRSTATGTGRAMKNISQAKVRQIAVCYPKDTTVAKEAFRVMQGFRQCQRQIALRMISATGLVRSIKCGQIIDKFVEPS